MNFRWYALPLVALLAGCSSGGSAIYDTFQYAATAKKDNSVAPRLNPSFSYLRVTVEGRPLFLARGSIDAHPQGPIEVWYSSSREVIRLQNGRIVGSSGTSIEWREVLIPPMPSWSAIARAKEFTWLRTRDVMPGYRFGVNDRLVLRLIEPPGNTSLVGIQAKNLTWFEETIREPQSELPNESLQSFEALPPARYAVAFSDGGEQVVYGEQCLARTFCFTWQRWNSDSPSAN